MSAARRLPAYAGELAAARKRGLTLRVPQVAVSLNWWRPATMYGVSVPPEQHPAALDWSWCRGLGVIIWRRGEPVERVRAAVGAIRASRPRSLSVVDVEMTTPDCSGSVVIHIIWDPYVRARQAA